MSNQEWLCRNKGVISTSQQRALSNSRIAVAGLGGVGGICADILLRAGVGSLSVADFDKYDRTNFNRQINSSSRTLGVNKAVAFSALARSINSKIKLKIKSTKITESNAKSFVSGCDVVIDCLDNITSRVHLFRACKSHQIPYVYAAASGERGMVSVFTGNADLENILHLPSRGKYGDSLRASLINYPQCRNAWGANTNLVGILAANSALNFALKKPYPKAPLFDQINSFSPEVIRKVQL